MRWLLVICAGLLCLGRADPASAQQKAGGEELEPTIFVNVDASTWKTRGRLLYDVKGTLLKKIALAGFHVIRDSSIPHEFELWVMYREEQGAQYDVDAWGTTIRVDFRFSGNALPHSVQWHIVEFSENAISGSPPYLDALVKLETHPYYFFLGNILMDLVRDKSSLREGLKDALINRIKLVYASSQSSLVMDRATAQDHFMDPSSVVYQDLAFYRAIEALQDDYDKDPGLLLVARTVLSSPARALRLQAVQLLAEAEDFMACPRLRGMALTDEDIDVREHAQRFIVNCPSS